MTDNNEGAPWYLQVSVKTPNGTLINIRGLNEEDLTFGLQSIQNLAGAISDTETAVGAAQVVRQQLGGQTQQRQQQPQQQQGGYNQGQQRQQPQAPPQAPPPSAGPAPLCDCNQPAKLVPGGVAKRTGRPYQAFWACPQDQNFQCNFKQQA